MTTSSPIADADLLDTRPPLDTTDVGAPPAFLDAPQAIATAVLDQRGAPQNWRTAPIRHGLASAVIDAVMTPRITTPTVEATVRRYEAGFGTGEVADLLASFDVLGTEGWRREIATNHRTFSSESAPYKADAVLAAALVLRDHCVTDVGDLWARAEDADLRAAWCAVPGQSSGATWRHLLLVSGYTEVLLCPITRRFARRALTADVLQTVDLARVIAEAADILDVSAFDLEHQMWRAAISPSRPREARDDSDAVTQDE